MPRLKTTRWRKVYQPNQKRKKKNQKTADAAILISDNSLKARSITKNKEDKYL